MANKDINHVISELIKSVLFIDEIHMLDIKCPMNLKRTLESNLLPIVMLAIKRGVCTIRVTDIISLHEIPVVLLDKLLNIRVSWVELN
jgi:RuvB-like protein 1 (pontin 52)